MADTGRSIVSEVRDRVSAFVKDGENLCVGLSGGVDSMVLLDALDVVRGDLGVRLSAVHVHHGLSRNAGDWEAFCAHECGRREIPFHAMRVAVERSGGQGIEAAARNSRYAAFASLGVEWVALAHHADDDAETVLLRLFRGTGIKGLAGIRPVRALNELTRILRPLLRFDRAALVDYAKARDLDWIEDDSNLDITYDRNFLRREVLPLVAARFSAFPWSVTRSAELAWEAQRLMDDLARIDLGGFVNDATVPIALLRALSVERARNVLRFFMEASGVAMPDRVHLSEATRQIRECSDGAQFCIELSGWHLRRNRDRVELVSARADVVPADFVRLWRAEDEFPVPELRGRLLVSETVGAGIARDLVQNGAWAVRNRRGGERLKPDCRRATRTLKNLFQEGGIAPRARARLPILVHNSHVVWVPGIGIDCAYQCRAGDPGLVLTWIAAGTS